MFKSSWQSQSHKLVIPCRKCSSSCCKETICSLRSLCAVAASSRACWISLVFVETVNFSCAFSECISDISVSCCLTISDCWKQSQKQIWPLFLTWFRICAISSFRSRSELRVSSSFTSSAFSSCHHVITSVITIAHMNTAWSFKLLRCAVSTFFFHDLSASVRIVSSFFACCSAAYGAWTNEHSKVYDWWL